MDIQTANHAFVTGGASGIGLAIARAFAARGIATTIADANQEAMQTTLATAPQNLRGLVLDVRDRTAWEEAKAGAEATFGPVDILVNNAGIAPDGWELADMQPESFDRLIAINLTGVFNGIHAFAADMRGRGRGHIVNTSSMAGVSQAFPGAGAYIASKFGVVGLSEALQQELAPHGIGVSILCPGQIATALMQNSEKMGARMRYNHQLVSQDHITADDVAQMVLAGIEADALFIATHPAAWWPRVRARHTLLQEIFTGSAG